MTKINYQRIYEDVISSTLKETAGVSARFYELPDSMRYLVEELMDVGHASAIEDALDSEVLLETSDLAGEMSNQLKGFQTVIDSYLSKINPGDGTYL